MKICTSYYQNESVRKKVDELRFSAYALNDALGYAKRHPEKRVIVEILDLHEERTPSMSKLNQLHQEQTNIYYDFYNLPDLIEYSRNFNREPNYIMYHQPVLTWALVQILLYYNVSDMVIGEPLIFNINELKANICSRGVQLRVRPYLAKSKIAREIETDAGIHHFWVLPQHVKFYEDVVAVLDLLDDNVIRESALVDAYTSDKGYATRLDTLIEGVECDIGASFIDDKFVMRRLACNQTCMKNSNNCHFCDKYAKMYKVAASQHNS